MKAEVDWSGFTSEAFAKYCERVKRGDLHDDDYLGCCRIGDVCFELATRSSGADYIDGSLRPGKWYLIYDLYVGGVDDGYGYSKIDDGYPYTYKEGGSFHGLCETMSYDDFKQMAMRKFEAYLHDVNCLEQAMKPLHIW